MSEYVFWDLSAFGLSMCGVIKLANRIEPGSYVSIPGERSGISIGFLPGRNAGLHHDAQNSGIKTQCVTCSRL